MIVIIIVAVLIFTALMIYILHSPRLSSPSPPPPSPLSDGQYYLQAGTVFLSESNSFLLASASKSPFTFIQYPQNQVMISVNNKTLDMMNYNWDKAVVYAPILTNTRVRWEYESTSEHNSYRFSIMIHGTRVCMGVKRTGVDVYCVIGFAGNTPADTVDEFRALLPV